MGQNIVSCSCVLQSDSCSLVFTNVFFSFIGYTATQTETILKEETGDKDYTQTGCMIFAGDISIHINLYALSLLLPVEYVCFVLYSYSLERENYYRHISLALKFKDQYISIILDGM